MTVSKLCAAAATKYHLRDTNRSVTAPVPLLQLAQPNHVWHEFQVLWLSVPTRVSEPISANAYICAPLR